MRLVHYYPRALVGDGGPTRAMWTWASATYSAGCDVAVLYDADLEAQSPLRNPAIPIVPLKHTGAGLIRVPRPTGRCPHHTRRPRAPLQLHPRQRWLRRGARVVTAFLIS